MTFCHPAGAGASHVLAVYSPMILVARLMGRESAAYQFTALPRQVAAWTGRIQQAVSVGI